MSSANCKKQGIDPEADLVEVLRRLPHNATVAEAAKLTPAAIAAEWRARAVDAEGGRQKKLPQAVGRPSPPGLPAQTGKSMVTKSASSDLP